MIIIINNDNNKNKNNDNNTLYLKRVARKSYRNQYTRSPLSTLKLQLNIRFRIYKV